MRNYKFKINNVKTMDKELCKFMKVCSICGQLKLVIHFHKRKDSKDGTRKDCKLCIKTKYVNTCVQCGNKFHSGKKEKRFCSSECYHKWQSENIRGEAHHSYNKIKVKCDYCGEYIPTSPYKLSKNKHNFCSVECKGKWMSINQLGNSNANWNPKLTQEDRENSRNIEGYKDFIKEVFERDNYTCQCCGDNKGHNLNAHHLNSYDWDKEHRTDINNGITLCEKCHKEFHHIYGYGDNTKEQFEEYLKQQNKDNNEVA